MISAIALLTATSDLSWRDNIAVLNGNAARNIHRSGLSLPDVQILTASRLSK
jgi:hypothetical protein